MHLSEGFLVDVFLYVYTCKNLTNLPERLVVNVIQIYSSGGGAKQLRQRHLLLNLIPRSTIQSYYKPTNSYRHEKKKNI
jgi:hypothetical protein